MANHGHYFGPWSKPFKAEQVHTINSKNGQFNKLYKVVKVVYLEMNCGVSYALANFVTQLIYTSFSFKT
jgi:hypothetical protein